MTSLNTGPNVLLVDDEIAFVETMTKRLKKRKMNILTAFSGAEALRVMEENKTFVEVVILDVKMPGLDGIEVLETIKRDYPLVEVIMLTGHATVSSAIDGMKIGAFDYLLKPCDIEELVDKTNRASKRKKDHEDKVIEARMKEILKAKA